MDSLPCTLIIPAAGDSARFQEKTSLPKGMVKFSWNGRYQTMIEHVVPPNWDGEVFIGVRRELYSVFSRLPQRFGIVPLPQTSGQAETVLRMAFLAPPSLDLLVVNSDNAFAPGTLEQFVAYCRLYDVCLGALTFQPKNNLERYGYVSDHPNFTCGAEKNPISRYALAGAFYFQSPNLIIKRAGINTKFISEWFIDMPKPKRSLCIAGSELHEWGTAELLEKDVGYINWLENTP